MNNIVRMHPQVDGRLTTSGPDATAQLFKSALLRLLAHARTESMHDTVMMLELTMTAIDEDMGRRRSA